MAIARNLTNGNRLVDWTLEVNEIDNQYGLLNDMEGLFEEQGIAEDSIVFDRNLITRTLLPQVNRRANEHSTGKDRDTDTYALALPYFNHQDYVVPSDIQGWRQVGTADQPRMLAEAVRVKFEDMRSDFDQTTEYMRCRAITGQTVDGQGKTIADMFTVLNITGGRNGTNNILDFDLGNSNTQPDQKIMEMKRKVAKEAKSGGRIGRIEVMCTPEFFDALTTHPKMREAYLYYASQAQSDVVRADLATYERWGIVDTFVHKGVMFFSYDAEFNVEDSAGDLKTISCFETLNNTTIVDDFSAISGGQAKKGGYTIVQGVRDAYRGYYGPANRLNGANRVGQRVFAYQYRDPKDKFEELEIESAPLYILTKPQLSLKLYSSS